MDATLTPLVFPRTDGDPSKRPSNTDPTPDSSKQVNYHKYLAADNSQSIQWRRKVGDELAKALGLPDNAQYILDDWPEHYAFFDHHKGPISNPRHDLYLFGSPYAAKFRSTNEFVPHAIWLFTDETLTPSNCKCKYCTRSKTQTQISQAHGLSIKRDSDRASPPKTRKPGLAEFRRVSQPLRSRNAPKQLCSHRRVNDLRSRRWFREGELVWCSVFPELQPSGSLESLSVTVKFWPGLVQDHSLKVYIQPRNSDGNYGIRQTYRYTVKLLSLNQTVTLPESSILPYQAFQPPTELLVYLHQCPKASLATELDMQLVSSIRVNVRQSSELDELEQTELPFQYEEAARSIEQVVTPLTLGIEIAAQLAGLWSATDDWKYDGLEVAENGTKRVITENRFQGLWWGNERIWQEDLVRLKVQRNLLAPQQVGTVLPPSHLADSRGVLMRISSIFYEVSGDITACRVSGMLYEVAEPDWETRFLDPSLLPQGSKPISVSNLSAPRPTAPFSSTSESNISNGRNLSQQVAQPNLNAASTSTPSPSKRIFMTPPQQPLFSSHSLTLSPSQPNYILSTASPAVASTSNGLAQAADGAPLVEEEVIIGSQSPLTDLTTSDNAGLSCPPPVVHEGPDQQQYRFPLPPPPDGYVFRPILPQDHEVWVDISQISGRYYSRLFDAPLLQPYLNQNQMQMDGVDLPAPERHTWEALHALNALLPGRLNSAEASIWHPSRWAMVKQADYRARMICHEYWNGPTAQPLETGPEPQNWLSPLPSTQQSIMTAALD